MTSIPRMSQTLIDLFEKEAPALAKQVGLRQRKISFSQLAYLLVLGWWTHPHAGPSALARFAGSLGLTLCKQDVQCHFTERTAAWLLGLLRTAVRAVVSANAVQLPLLSQFTAVLIEDGSSISLPSALQSVWKGCGGRESKPGKEAKTQAGLKITVRWDLLAGQLHGPHLQEGRAHDLSSVLRELVMPKGSLWIADLGYWSLCFLRHLCADGVFFLMRLKEGVALWHEGRRVDVLELLPKLVGERVEQLVDLGAGKAVRGVRMLAERVPAHVVEQRHKRLYQYAQDHGKVVSARALELAQWTILVTNVPASMLSFTQATALIRARWQIELLFKLWKEHALIDEWNSSHAFRILCEVYAKLLAMVVQHWFVLLSCWDDPHRSLSGVAQILREQVPTLVHGLRRQIPLRRAIRLIIASVAGGCTQPQRSTRVSTSYRLLAALDSGLT